MSLRPSQPQHARMSVVLECEGHPTVILELTLSDWSRVVGIVGAKVPVKLTQREE